MSEDAWVAGRREAARVHAEALARTELAEQAKARGLLRDFVTQATQAGLAPQTLKARSRKGARYATDITGWYLRLDCSLGVDLDANYYSLRVEASPLARFRRVQLEPAAPPLIVGRGGRDGDVIDLKDLLARRLAAGADWPS